MINPELVLHIFKAASISRWNDFPRVCNLVELDKQAHKAIIAYFLAKCEKDIKMDLLVNAIMVEFVSRIIITDIRPDVLNEIKKTKQNELNDWIKEEFSKINHDIKFKEIFIDYYTTNKYDSVKDILKAAGYLSTKYEFNYIYQNVSNYEEIKQKLEEELEDYIHLIAVQKIALNKKLAKIIDLSGRLRFQKRWAQTPRIPETSVLGHMLIVAVLSYFYCIKIQACEKRLVNNFFCALFHDLPESLTRDIISPVKYGVKGLSEIISEYELRLIDEKILPYVPLEIKDEFAYLLGIYEENGKIKKDEFLNRQRNLSKITILEEISQECNSNNYDLIDGKALKACDKTAAFLEALISNYYGVKSRELIEGYKSTIKNFEKDPIINGVNFLEMLNKFEEFFKDPSQETCGTHL